MHSCCLGVTLNYNGLSIWALVENGYVNVKGATKPETRKLRLKRINESLRNYYRSQPSSITRISRITFKMLGPPMSQNPRFKAAESRHLLPYVVQELAAQTPAVNPNFLRAGQRLLELHCLLAENGQYVSPGVEARAMVLLAEHVWFFTAAGGKTVFKHHFLSHGLERMGRCGNLMYTWVYGDEAYNGKMKLIARTARNPLTFPRIVLEKCLRNL